MPWNIGGVELADHEPVSGGTINFGAKGRWVNMNPIGFKGRIRQYLGQDANDHDLQVYCGEVTMLALKALSGPTPITVIFPRPTFESGVDVTVEEVNAVWTDKVPGEWTQAQLDASLGDHPTGDAFGLYLVTITVVDLVPL